MDGLMVSKSLGDKEKAIRAQLGQTAKSPYDVPLNLELAQVLQDEGKYPELNERLATIAGLTNWDNPGVAGVVQYYVEHAHNIDAAFLEARAKIDPKNSVMIYDLAALHASEGHRTEALNYLGQAVAAGGGTNALMSAKLDPRFSAYQKDPGFETLERATNGLVTVPPGEAPKAHGAAKTPPKKHIKK
jgi:hypothetical protein